MGSLPVSFGRGRVRPGVRRPTPQGGRVTQSRRGGGPRGNRLGGWSLALQDSVARQAMYSGCGHDLAAAGRIYVLDLFNTPYYL
ncbi:hypothetical protein HPP92_004675 [Vanilla planifolia]|uniref:Uncharacterized protein n=1 Tax=Vanilla planifolia TaxID=51239 RepID=A0A835RSJ7_VANPL|nr:hypothetical protein HPP92_004675 [Vanilla planifolia]